MRNLLFIPDLLTLLIRRIIYSILLFSFILFWLLTTESGLKATLWSTKSFLKGNITVKTITGTLLSDIHLHDISWDHPHFTLQADAFSSTPDVHAFFKNKLSLTNIELKNAVLIIKNDHTMSIPPIHINATAQAITLNLLTGNIQTLNLGDTHITMGPNVLTWKQEPIHTETKNTLHWHFNHEADDFSVNSHGFLEFDHLDNVEGKITHLKLNFHSHTLGPLIFGNIDINNVNIPKIFAHRKPNGQVIARITDLSAISKLFPVIARPSGEINATLTLEGTFENPILALQASLTHSKFYLPKERIKVKELDLTLQGDVLNTLTLSGVGHLGEGLFTVIGTTSPFLQGSPNEFILKGKNLSLHDTANIFIIASPDLKLRYNDHTLFAEGSIDIPKGAIIDRNETTIARSQDVVFKKPTRADQFSQTSTISPNVQLNIDEGFRYVDNKLDIILKGKLHVDKRPDGHYAGDGRLTIVEGQYRLDTGTQYIKRGRLLFFTGTLLSDPLLDIKMGPKPSAQKKVSEENIYVYGTLKKPNVQLLETSQKTFETLAKIGLSSKAGFAESGKKLESRLLTSGTKSFIDIEKLQNNMGFEFGFETKETHQNLDSPLTSSTTVFVIGKPLSENLSIQFLQGLGKNISSGRLKYSLSEHFDASIEHGTDGTGADLMFSMESN